VVLDPPALEDEKVSGRDGIDLGTARQGIHKTVIAKTKKITICARHYGFWRCHVQPLINRPGISAAAICTTPLPVRNAKPTAM
jgi:hypothetical protein